MVPSVLSSALLLVATANAANGLFLHDHDSVKRRYFEDDSWSQPGNHFTHALFKRAPSGSDGASYPQVGSSEWSSKYPAAFSTPGNDRTPQEWLAQLKIAQDAGKIPDIPVATMGSGGSPVYQNADAGGPQICSSTYQCRASDVIYDSPDNVFSISFDDGPLPPTPTLVDFLQKNNEIGTHFMIGGNVLSNPSQFQSVFNYGGDLAVHTWSHPYMTTLTNEQVVAELGWTMQIIHDSSGGRVPRVWRPPYGDSDHRVRAIASEVFGLVTVIWNQDSADWQIANQKQTLQGIDELYDKVLPASKSPGLMILEHELSDQTVQAFMENYPKIKANGWQTASLARVINGTDPYRNVQGDNVAPASVYLVSGTTSQPASSTSSASSSASTTGSSSTANPTTNASSNTSKSNSATSSWKTIFSVASTLLSVAVPCLVFVLS
ncbi:hypothetical protein V5O48_002311 [Marasmius crinis-equi]|uniref:chitin deacetylase n=1 Tax=Marasmius crinis-equi TaxID=585013 RepID=A0ABR3FW00_9AGAR